jgi:thiamine biosynthesis lipoprotein
MSIKTDGVFNPFILPMLQRTGYRKSFLKQYEHDYQEDYSGYRVADPSELIIGDDYAQIPELTALDMGGCGKGYLADLLAGSEELDDLQGYWLSLGGDIVGRGTDENDTPWSISVENAIDPDTMLDYEFPMTTRKFSIATSGVIHRKGVDGKRRWHHLIDPATGTAATTDIFLATVTATTTLEADVLASCAVIKGSKQALDYLKKHGAKAALIQSKSVGSSVKYDYFGKVVEREGVTV